MYVYSYMHVDVFVYASQYVSQLACRYATTASTPTSSSTTASSTTTTTTSLFHPSLVHLHLSLSLPLLLIC